MKLKNSIVTIYLFFLAACVSDKPDVKPNAPILASPGSGVFITNEGNFQWGNASVSYYNFADGVVTEDAFKVVNNRPLGDVCQSMEVFNGKAYVVVNNSNKIEIVNPQNFNSMGVIKGLISPRYFLGINASKAYVTDLYSNAISVIDLNSNSKVKDISCPGWTEELALVNGKAFVTNLRKEYVYIINTLSDVLEDSVKVGFAPNSIHEDKNGKLWILCGGSSSDNIPGSLHRVDPGSEQVELSLSFTSVKDSPGSLTINGTKDTLYYLNNGVHQMPIAMNTLPVQALILQNNLLFHGLGIDPVTGIIYLSDAIDYVQKGKIYRYKTNGILIDQFNVGIIPNSFCFY